MAFNGLRSQTLQSAGPHSIRIPAFCATRLTSHSKATFNSTHRSQAFQLYLRSLIFSAQGQLTTSCFFLNKPASRSDACIPILLIDGRQFAFQPLRNGSQLALLLLPSAIATSGWVLKQRCFWSVRAPAEVSAISL